MTQSKVKSDRLLETWIWGHQPIYATTPRRAGDPDAGTFGRKFVFGINKKLGLNHEIRKANNDT